MVVENLINLSALVDVFFENKKNDLKNVDTLTIVITNKNSTKTEINIKKDELLNTLINMFNSDINEIKDIDIFFDKNGEKNYINGISIF